MLLSFLRRNKNHGALQKKTGICQSNCRQNNITYFTATAIDYPKLVILTDQTVLDYAARQFRRQMKIEK